MRDSGFTLPELLLAVGIGSLIMLGAMRFLPALQHGVLVSTQHHQARALLWQLARSIGKSVRRAGYCNGECPGPGLSVSPAGDCLIVQWDMNSNGRWETAPDTRAEQLAYRLSGDSLETRRGAADCRGRGWQKMNDPAALRITRFRAWPQANSPLVAIALSGVPVTTPAAEAVHILYYALRHNPESRPGTPPQAAEQGGPR
ncbi:prepilin peptidase dependent protein B [Shimwellia blattae DSM 4481 = NBRC 105725]|uniref:Prepilin peptidase dependent protein B n=2 Tax=Shimwellia blattae TaxID=563 RepID=I2B5X4_SHIBC|nr:prepilin peptidase dependent protein B [Shimwellia blattae DSM 4481 = NBRC 105725]GAB81685.1 prepilin peptidase-dependent protein B [Shimwellia blattae DSM 4481 = NBRC 105725]VDY63404.1 Type II secretory pathway, component PulJ [Shimwellia blattae]VEC21266.1 Type II secretory pathway, component PulJ [Shimwellia blattae]